MPLPQCLPLEWSTTFELSDEQTHAAIRVKDVQALRDGIILLRDDAAQRQIMQQAALQFSATYSGATIHLMALVARHLSA